MPSPRIKRSAHKIDYRIDRQLGVLFDHTNEFKICMLDSEGRIIGWNTSAEKMTGFSKADVMGKSYSMFISKEEAREGLLKKALQVAAKTGQFSAEGIRVRKDGSHFWARSVITPMKDVSGCITFFVLITKNISREKEIEFKKEEYIGIASHELKNPITTLALYSELLAQRLQLESDKKNLHMLRDIQGQAARLTALIDDLLLVSKIEGGKLELHKETFDLEVFVTDIIRHFRNGHPSHDTKLTGRIARHVYADKGRIAQVLINLLTNAVKYSPGADAIHVNLKCVDDKCIISIKDFGPGIEKKDQRDIFTRFFRVGDSEPGNAAGSGLGLYIA